MALGHAGAYSDLGADMEAMIQWQDITTYPDDIAIRLLVVGGVVFPGCYAEGRWWLVRPRYDAWGYVRFRSLKTTPTHWMQLPRPPTPSWVEASGDSE